MFHFTYSFISIQAIALPESLAMDRELLLYYVSGATIFCVFGVLTGYFIWRRSHLQFAEIRRQNKQATEALKEFQDEIEGEKIMLEEFGAEIPSEELAAKKEKKRKKKKEPEPTVTEDVSGETSPIVPEENPVAKAMRRDSPKTKVQPAPVKKQDKTDDDLFF